MKKLFKRRRKNQEVGPETGDRVSKRRDFRIDRLEKKAALIKQRKWVFISIAIIVVAIAAIVFKVM